MSDKCVVDMLNVMVFVNDLNFTQTFNIDTPLTRYFVKNEFCIVVKNI